MAVLFVFALFFTKNKDVFKNITGQGGLVYNGDEKVEELITRDTDKDEVPDWQEGLFGTDPTKKDTDEDGISDKIEITRISGQEGESGALNLNASGLGSSTQTDLFAKELFSTVAALNQAGVIDQSAVDKISDSLVQKMQNSENRKVFVYSDLKIINSDTWQSIKNYSDSLNGIHKKYPYPNYTVLDVLDKFIIDENNVDEGVLVQLDPIIKQTNNIINEMAKMNVPASLAIAHLEFLNEFQKFSENVRNIKLYESDIVLAVSGISQYETTSTTLDSATDNLANAINQRLR